MLNDALKPMLNSGLLNETTQAAINEAWNAKLVEVRSEIRAEVRNDLAERYNHDKTTMIEALDKMVSEALEPELLKIRAEKKAVSESRRRGLQQIQKLAERFHRFMSVKLTEEIQELRQDRKSQKQASANLENFVMKSLVNEVKELRQDRKSQKQASANLENFVMKSLAEEITEFAQDKRNLIETRVKLVAQAGKKLNELKSRFVKRSATLVSETVARQLKKELTQLHDDISVAKKNNFGRRIFEAFASEFSATHLNENAEMRRLNSIIDAKNSVIATTKQSLQSRAAILEAKNKELQSVKDLSLRQEIIGELLGPLDNNKSQVMSQLLENVQTSRLRAAYDKYLPAVLNNSAKATAILTENKTAEVTGNKTAKVNQFEDTNIIDMKRLAGL